MFGVIKTAIRGTALVTGLSIGAYDRRNETVLGLIKNPSDIKEKLNFNREDVKKKLNELFWGKGKKER